MHNLQISKFSRNRPVLCKVIELFTYEARPTKDKQLWLNKLQINLFMKFDRIKTYAMVWFGIDESKY